MLENFIQGSSSLKKLRSVYAIFFVFTFLLSPYLTFRASASTPSWIQTVDSSGLVGSYSSIALDSKGNPHIAYSDLINDNLKYASLSSSGWNIEIVDPECNTSFCSLDFDTNDNPHISYYDNWNSDLKYAHWNGLYWNIQIIESTGYVGGYSSLRVDSTDKPHIAYQEGIPNFDLKYASLLDSGWEIQNVDSFGYVGFFASLALDMNDNPKISYVEMINGSQNNSLKFASWEGTKWTIEVVDSTGDVGRFNSLDLDSNGNAYISYFDGMNGILKYASQVDFGWNLELVDYEGYTGNLGSQTSIALDSSDYPHIAYVDEKDFDIRYAWYNGSSWSIQVINSDGEYCRGPSLALSPKDYPRISYYDSGDLKYAAVNATSFPTPLISPTQNTSPPPAPQPSGIQFVESGVADIGMMSALALDSKGYPCIAYLNRYRLTNSSIKYAQWTGSNWNIQTVKGDGIVGRYPSLALDSKDNPHIVYRNIAMLEYVSWNGSDWNFQTVGSPGEFGSYNSLLLDSNDNPRLSYRETKNSELRYATLSDSGWNLNTVDAEGNSIGSHNSLAIDSYGNPHISYMQSIPAIGLKYAYYNGSGWHIETVDAGGAGVGFDSSIAVDYAGRVHISYFSFIPGTSNCFLKYAVKSELGWQIVAIDSGNGTGKDTSLALDSNGNPHISYYDANRGDLRYAWWNGSVWIIRIIDSAGNVGEASSLALDSNDQAHISYYDRTNTDLKYVNLANFSGFSQQDIQTVQNVQTSVSMNVLPNPVGVGQQININVSIAPNPPATEKRFTGVTLWITRPDGTTVTLGPWIIEPKASLYAVFTPAQVGNYTLKLNYAGQYFSSSNVTYISSHSPSTILAVQQQQVPNSNPEPSRNTSGPILGLIRIMPDGTVQGTDKIQRNGNIYTLTDDIKVELNSSFGNLKPCLLIMRDFAIVDGAGHVIQSNGTGLGIYARGVQGVTIKNFKIRGFAEGISFYTMDPVPPIEILYRKTANNKIINNNIDVVNYGNPLFLDISGWGIYVEFSEDTIVAGNTIKTSDASKGLFVGGTCNRTTITNNRFIDCGMDLFTLKQKIIIGNTIDGKPVIFLDGLSNQIVEDAEQVLVYNCYNITVRNISPNNDYRRTIQLEDTKESTVTACKGIIALTNSINNSVYGNSPKNIALFESNYNKVFENIITAGGVIFPRGSYEYYYGRRCIDLMASNHNEIYDNTLKDSNSGIRLGTIKYGSQFNNIYMNRIFNIGQGVEFAYSSENNIYLNQITNCSVGIRISISQGINATKNSIIRCGTAVSICGSNNIFYRNNFFENSRQASVVDQTLFSSNIIIAYSTNNLWDNGKEGNYWSNYNGTDANGDGVGDQSYAVCENNVDRHPLMSPVQPSTTGTAISTSTQENAIATQPTDNTTPPIGEPTPTLKEPLDVDKIDDRLLEQTTNTNEIESKLTTPKDRPSSIEITIFAILLGIAIVGAFVGPLNPIRRKH